MKNTTLGIRFCTLLSVCALAAPLLAQTPQGQILGAISDTSGGSIAAASVTLENERTGIRKAAISSESGDYVFSYLDSGFYKLTVERTGFKMSVFTGIQLQLAEKKRVDARLEVGDVATKVEVQAAAALVETDSSTIGSMVSRREVTDLPLPGRNFSYLAVLQPGVVSAGTTGGAIVTVFGLAVQVGGTSSGKNFYSMDGVDNTFNFFNGPAMNPSIDSIQEFRIDRNLASAEFGNGGAELHTVTKSGTNRFHGALWDYMRNYNLNAGNYFTHRQDTIKRNQFGANLGGPVKKNKWFFFFNWESQREVSTAQPQGTVFSDKMRKGDLSEWPTAPVDPLNNRTPFPNAQIPADRMNKVMLDQMNALMPLATQPGILNNAIRPFATVTDYDQFIGRSDYKLSAKDDLFVRYSHQPRTGVGAPLSVSFLNAIEDFKFWNFGSGLTRTWSPRTISETRFSFQGQRIFVDTVPPATKPATSITGFGGGPTDHLPTINIAQFASFGQAGNPLEFTFNTFEVIQNATLLRSNHVIKFGGQLRKFDMDTPIAYTKNTWPNLTFTQAYTNTPIGDYLLGYPFSALGILAWVPRETNYNGMGLFVQDDWKVSRKLTLNLGLRYDLRTRGSEAHNQWASFDPATRKIAIAGDSLNEQYATPFVLNAYRSFLIPSTQAGLPSKTLAYGDHNNLAFRFGFAWRPFDNNKTVLRGGYGIFYILPDGNNQNTNTSSIPFGGRANVQNTTPVPTITADTPFGGSSFGIPAPSGYYLHPQIRDGYLQQVNFSIQRELPWRMLAEINVQDQNSLKLESGWNLNQPRAGAGAIQDRRPYPEYVSLSGLFQDGHSRYDALELMLRKSSEHMTFQFSHTFAKQMSFGSYLDPYNRHLFDGPTGFANNMKFHVIADLPFGKGRKWMHENTATDLVLGGWTLSMIAQPYLCCSRLSVSWIGDNANVGVGTVRPDRIADGRLDNATPQKWLDQSAFVAPRAGTFGNAGTGIINGPSSKNADAAIYKNFQIREAWKIQFRAEAFSVFNHPNFANPNTTVNGVAFGQITTVSHSPRVMQLALRLDF